MVSVKEQTPSPQTAGGAQSRGQLTTVSPASQTVLPQTGPMVVMGAQRIFQKVMKASFWLIGVVVVKDGKIEAAKVAGMVGVAIGAVPAMETGRVAAEPPTRVVGTLWKPMRSVFDGAGAVLAGGWGVGT